MSTVDIATTEYVTSSDGTRIAFSRSGSGPVLVLVDGAMCHRGFGPSGPFTKELQDAFSVVTYDRRGRGESGDQPASDVESDDFSEVDDLRAVIEAVGPDVSVLSFSSGGGIAYRAAAAAVPMRKLVAYETPFVGLRSRNGRRLDYVADLTALLAAGQRGKMVDYFMVRMVGAPAFLPIMFRLMGKTWKQMQAIAPTLLNDTRVMGGDFEVPVDVLSGIRTPVMVVHGSKAKPEMSSAQVRIAASIPGAEHRVLDKQTHNVAPSALRPELIRFLKEQ